MHNLSNNFIRPILYLWLVLRLALGLVVVPFSMATAGDLLRVEIYDAVSQKWHPVLVELAETSAERKTGLMHRQFLPQDQGMLFIYPQEKHLSFWMKNTLIPLDIMYFSTSGEWVNTAEDTTPLSLDGHPSAGPAQFVLEMVAGSAKTLHIGEGSRLFIKDCHMIKTGLDFGPCSR
jgi:uncharacterized membrane protein (UPF0127 family)